MQKENKVIVKLNCFPGPCRTGENRGSRFFVSDGWDNLRKKIGRCRFFRRPQDRHNTDFNVGLTPDLHAKQRGFTLIELLVVVLIIGILAAVALPQYQVAVAKSRYIRMVSVLSTLRNAEEVYYLANGTYVDDAAALDVDGLNGCNTAGGGFITCPDFFLDINAGVAFNNPIASMYDYALSYVYFQDHSVVDPGQRECWAFTNHTLANKVCKSMGGEANGTATYDTMTWNRYKLP